MLILGSRLVGTPVMSLQTGVRLARVLRPIIDPATLAIYAYELEGSLLAERPSFLRIADIREMSGVGMIIDSADEFVGLHDIIKLEELNELGFALVGMKVIDERRRHLGKIEDYTIESNSFVIQQLNVKRGLIKGITNTGLLIHRSQIVEINDQHIIVKSNQTKVTEPKAALITPAEYVNPFRSPTPTPEQREH